MAGGEWGHRSRSGRGRKGLFRAARRIAPRMAPGHETAVQCECSPRRYDRWRCPPSTRTRSSPTWSPAQREAVTTVRGPLCILAGRGHRQDPRDHASCRVRARDRRGPAVGRAGRHVHGQGRHRDARPPGRGRPAGRVGVHVPRRGPAPAPPLLAAHPRRGPARRSCRRRCSSSRRSPRRCRAATATSPSATWPAEIEWAKARRISPGDVPRTASLPRATTARLPPDLMARAVSGDYETARDRAGLIDFEDMLARTVELLETDDAAAAEVRDRYRWFSVDEYQDTNPLQQAVLDAWLGGRDDLAVVGDEDQTIYTFTGATSDYLTGFPARYPAAQDRPPREQLPFDAAGPRAGEPRAGGGTGGARTSAPRGRWRGRRSGSSRRSMAGPAPHIAGFDTDEAELAGDDRHDPDAGPRRHRARRDGRPRPDQRPAAGAGGRPRGGGHPVPRPRRAVLRSPGGPSGAAGRRDAGPTRRTFGAWRRRRSRGRLPARLAEAFERELGVRRADVPEGDAARERHAAVVTLLELAEDLAAGGSGRGRGRRSWPRSSVAPRRSRVERSTASSC